MCTHIKASLLAIIGGWRHNQKSVEQQVVSVVAVQGDLDVVRYNIWAMKDVGYMAQITGTASRLFYPND